MTTAVKERPILFSSPMVKAILAGRKTVTRRVVKPQPISVEECRKATGSDYSLFTDQSFPNQWRIAGPVGVVCERSGLKNGHLWSCPYGQPGDRLWVRESWGLHDTEPKDGPDNATVYYRATDGDKHDLRYQRWRPSIHMPRWASRITLEVEAVRVERLQDITSEEAFAEGFEDHVRGHVYPFRELWHQLNGPESWDSNPWVWVVNFRRMTP